MRSILNRKNLDEKCRADLCQELDKLNEVIKYTKQCEWVS